MSENYFVRSDDHYQRHIDPVNEYIEQMARYIQIKTQKPIEECKKLLGQFIHHNANGRIKNPVVRYLERQENGDRYSKQIKLSNYIKEVVDHGEILAPTMTSYVNTKAKQSILASFIEENVKRRSASKKIALAAQARGDMQLYIAKNNEQGIMKIYNNSLSGAFGSTGTSLFNLTAHSTLTSTTRAVSSLGNAINEKLIAGNRHYRNYYTVINNILAITRLANLHEVQKTVEYYGLNYPTTAEVMQCIEYSTKLYWNNPFYLYKIQSVVEQLTDVEKAAFVYIGDFYHIRSFNEKFVYDFLTKLKEKKKWQIEDPVSFIKKSDEAIVNFASIICSEEVKGYGKEYDKMPSIVLEVLCGTIENVEKVLLEYKGFIQTFFASDIIPSSVAYLPAMIRRAVVLSDTDSTMFSTDEYVRWYYKEMVFSTDALSLAASVAFLTTQSIANGLRILSANINVARNKLSILTMKPEFTFPVFVQTNVAKHYFASISIQEGNVFPQVKYEIKGVHLKSSAAPPAITKLSKLWMESIINDISDNKKISLNEKLKDLADLERIILQNINEGRIDFFRSAKIKELQAYAGNLSITPYFHHLLWTTVFENKYGTIEPIPYEAIKIPLDMPNKTAHQKWLDQIEDKDLAQRLNQLMLAHKKEKLGTVLINKNFCLSQGIPKEIIPVIDKKRVILELTKSFRMIIESLGMCLKKDMLSIEMGY